MLLSETLIKLVLLIWDLGPRTVALCGRLKRGWILRPRLRSMSRRAAVYDDGQGHVVAPDLGK